MLNTKFGNIIAKLRTERGLTQEQLAEQLTEFTGSDKVVTKITVSSYECNFRQPTTDLLIYMALFFDVSIDYLVGISQTRDFKKDANTVSPGSPVMEPDILLRPQEWKLNDKKPVFVVFPKDTVQPKWGILDYSNNQVILYNCILKLDPTIKLYKFKPLEAYYMNSEYRLPLTMVELIKTTEPVWVESLSKEEQVKAQYNGWYEHNSLNSMLINRANSLALTYEGCGISYNAYKV